MVGRLIAAAAAGAWGRSGFGGLRRTPSVAVVPSRNVTATHTGAILPKPVKISKNFAALLEEHDIFVPEDDDDDD
ncbi:essential MCU regulator, mitochondrial isoform X2 [Tiliqua scincoides]|uniref:essential MCU regulator, mitochondrial isoform X2 n=1 Tax=Tiliqua scincoides TaxID=71010 RepID=UPI0034618FCC